MTDITTIPELSGAGRLGRHVQHDPRSLNYPAPTATTIVDVAHVSAGLPLDQGNVGMCTATALTGALDTQPDLAQRTPFGMSTANALYSLETQLEGQPWPPNDPGGTGLMVSKAALQLGLIRSYQHAFGLDQALRALVIRPVIVGMNWMTSFDSPSPSGYVTWAKGATVRGGHEVVAVGIDTHLQRVYFWNSWGASWGLGGKFNMTWKTLGKLLAEQGDVVVPIV